LICEADKIEINGQAYCRLCKEETSKREDPHGRSSVDLLRSSRRPIWRTRYPAIEFGIRFLAVLSYVVLVGGVMLALAFFIRSLTAAGQLRRLLLLRSIASCAGAPLGFLLLQMSSQFFRLLVDIERNTHRS